MNKPKLWAGPILRRCDKHKINVWLASDVDDLNVNLVVFSKDTKSKKLNELPGFTKISSICVLKHCHFYMLTFNATQSLPLEELLLYDIKRSDNVSIFDADHLAEICINGFELPSFILQSENEPLRLAFGSCRLLHLDGGEDAISALLSSEYIVDTVRPHVFLLGGDQIYADDVSIHTSITLSKQLIPLLTGKPFSDQPATNINNRTLNKFASRRGEILPDFSSGHMNYQLISWAEFISMYLFVWSSNSMQYFAPVDHWAPIYSSIAGNPYEAGLWRERTKFMSDITAETKNYMKIFANTPTYMIGDDHEITDDWAIDSAWIKDNITPETASTNSKDVIRHGVVSYFLCQVWGNDPASANSLVGELKKYVQALDSYNANPSVEKIDEAMRSHSSSGGFISIVPSQPSIILMDTRVNRLPHDSPPRSWLSKQRDSVFFGEDTKNKIRGLASSSMSDHLIVVAPAPILNYQINSFSRFFQHVLSRKLDNEGWEFNFFDIRNFLECFHEKKIIYLTGDVHYGFACHIDIFYQGKKCSILQVTSSGLKNTNEGANLLRSFFKYYESVWLRYEESSSEIQVEEISRDQNDNNTLDLASLHCFGKYFKVDVREPNVFWGEIDGSKIIGKWLIAENRNQQDDIEINF
jgi:hypothetical protein